jgi:hypothetical protein
MIKLLDILRENKILVPRRSPEERQKNYLIATQKKIQQYIKDGGKGDLDLENTPIQSLPDGFKVGGILDLRGTPIQSLPPGLKVGSSLYLGNCKNLKALPSDLKVEGDLYLMNTPIQSLPDGLKVRGGLYLYNCKNLKSLPDDLKVEGNLDLRNTPISKKYTEEEIRKMVPGVRGNIYL